MSRTQATPGRRSPYCRPCGASNVPEKHQKADNKDKAIDDAIVKEYGNLIKAPLQELTREEFIAKAQRLIRHDDCLLNSLTVDEADAENVPDHSTKIFRLEHELAHIVEYEQAISLLYNCAWNKFKERSRRELNSYAARQ